MLKVEDVALWMVIIVGIVVVVVIVGFLVFVRWGGRENERNRITEDQVDN